MSFKVNKRLGKQIVVHSYNGITLSSKKEWTTKTQSSIQVNLQNIISE